MDCSFSRCFVELGDFGIVGAFARRRLQLGLVGAKTPAAEASTTSTHHHLLSLRHPRSRQYRSNVSARDVELERNDVVRLN